MGRWPGSSRLGHRNADDIRAKLATG